MLAFSYIRNIVFAESEILYVKPTFTVWQTSNFSKAGCFEKGKLSFAITLHTSSLHRIHAHVSLSKSGTLQPLGDKPFCTVYFCAIYFRFVTVLCTSLLA